MLIPQDDASVFLEIYPKLIAFASGRLGGVAGITDLKSFRNAPLEDKAEARDALLDNAHLIEAFVEENPQKLDDTILADVGGWKNFLHETFFIERDLQKYTVFLRDGAEPKAYGVLGLTDEIIDLVLHELPLMVTAVLLPWRNQIVCDGLIGFNNLVLGGGIRSSLRDTYREAKANGIITSLDPGWEPTVPATPKRPRSPAIVRFLRQCPKTVAEFEERYGEPRMDMGHEAAKEYSAWRLDGTPELDIDYLMLYANIMKNQVLYVYAKEGQITHIAVVDPTEWRRQDLKPHAGQRFR